jgi:divalent metal cation (Fe/Co/Zn/Cd) transporter
VRDEFGRLSGHRTDPDLDATVREVVDQIIAEHPSNSDFHLVDLMTVRRGKYSQVDLRVSYAGALTVAEADEIRDAAELELGSRIGSVRMYLAFSARPIHEHPGVAGDAA